MNYVLYILQIKLHYNDFDIITFRDAVLVLEVSISSDGIWIDALWSRFNDSLIGCISTWSTGVSWFSIEVNFDVGKFDEGEFSFVVDFSFDVDDFSFVVDDFSFDVEESLFDVGGIIKVW